MMKTLLGNMAGIGLLGAWMVMGLTGCQQKEMVTESSPEPHPSTVLVEAPVTPPPLTEEARTKLAVADAADGEEDHVVSKCITCALAMTGKATHSVVIEGYTFHLCSSGCKTMFVKDPSAALMAIKSPAE